MNYKEWLKNYRYAYASDGLPVKQATCSVRALPASSQGGSLAFFPEGWKWDATLLRWVEDKASPGCPHEWKTYRGLTETYDFCALCDEKHHNARV